MTKHVPPSKHKQVEHMKPIRTFGKIPFHRLPQHKTRLHEILTSGLQLHNSPRTFHSQYQMLSVVNVAVSTDLYLSSIMILGRRPDDESIIPPSVGIDMGTALYRTEIGLLFRQVTIRDKLSCILEARNYASTVGQMPDWKDFLE